MNISRSNYLILVLILQLAVNELLCAPLQDTDYSSNSLDCCSSKEKRQIPESKKDLFVSRGWGAGGMPFSVLYMSPHSSKAPLQSEPIYRAAPLSAPRLREQPKIEPPPRTYIKSRRQYSVIPQLFVSYGWGPMGKK